MQLWLCVLCTQRQNQNDSFFNCLAVQKQIRRIVYTSDIDIRYIYIFFYGMLLKCVWVWVLCLDKGTQKHTAQYRTIEIPNQKKRKQDETVKLIEVILLINRTVFLPSFTFLLHVCVLTKSLICHSAQCFNISDNPCYFFFLFIIYHSFFSSIWNLCI